MCRTVNQYAVKIIQGKIDPNISPQQIGTGLYFTSVNIHNPWKNDAIYHIKLVLSGFNGDQGKISSWGEFKLKYDDATEFDIVGYRNISSLPPTPIILPSFIEGFLVIECPLALDVVGVYTGSAFPDDRLGAMHMERVAPVKVIPGEYKPRGKK